MYGTQPSLPIDITLGLAPSLVATPTSTKYIQKIGNISDGPIGRLIYTNKRGHGTTNRTMTNAAGQ